eukprot:TRINITY_DN8570_c0_g1_i3.p2 TRINITY_DN8570_c0_g1~~TRINITY_DN8570_c0_g1_i3.p2  ORF type:complete len:102 (-),score=5.46 TRINITY_DN8570_c0_g1_i3:12-317(-)
MLLSGKGLLLGRLRSHPWCALGLTGHAAKGKKPSLTAPVVLADNTLLCCGGGSWLTRYQLLNGHVSNTYATDAVPGAFVVDGEDCIVATGSNSIWAMKDLL